MNKRLIAKPGLATTLMMWVALLPAAALAQVPVDEDGNLIGEY